MQNTQNVREIEKKLKSYGGRVSPVNELPENDSRGSIVFVVLEQNEAKAKLEIATNSRECDAVYNKYDRDEILLKYMVLDSEIPKLQKDGSIAHYLSQLGCR